MKKAYIDIAGKWAFVFAYRIGENDLDEISRWLDALGASKKDIRKACDVIMGINQGFTFTRSEQRMSVMCVSRASSKAQWYNTLVHEIDHLQHDICTYYDVPHGGEESAYLQGYIMQGIMEAINSE